MRDTRIRLLLGVVLLGVWGVVIYRFFTRLSGPAQNAPLAAASVAPPVAEFDYVLDSIPDNPFGVGKSRRSQRAPTVASSVSAPPRSPVPSQPEPPPTPFPDLSYVGYVDPDGGQPTALIRHGGQLLRMQPGQEIAGARIQRVTPEGCVIRFAEADSVLQRATAAPPGGGGESLGQAGQVIDSQRR